MNVLTRIFSAFWSYLFGFSSNSQNNHNICTDLCAYETQEKRNSLIFSDLWAFLTRRVIKITPKKLQTTTTTAQISLLELYFYYTIRQHATLRMCMPVSLKRLEISDRMVCADIYRHKLGLSPKSDYGALYRDIDLCLRYINGVDDVCEVDSKTYNRLISEIRMPFVEVDKALKFIDSCVSTYDALKAVKLHSPYILDFRLDPFGPINQAAIGLLIKFGCLESLAEKDGVIMCHCLVELEYTKVILSGVPNLHAARIITNRIIQLRLNKDSL